MNAVLLAAWILVWAIFVWRVIKMAEAVQELFKHR